MIRVTIQLTKREAEALRRPIVGSGGFQSLLRRIQGKLSEENVLTLDLREIERISRHVHRYGAGGFQDRLDGVLNALRRLVEAIGSEL